MKPATALALSLWLTLASAAAWAELQQEMDAMFSTLTNGSSPTAHLGQRRGC